MVGKQKEAGWTCFSSQLPTAQVHLHLWERIKHPRQLAEESLPWELCFSSQALSCNTPCMLQASAMSVLCDQLTPQLPPIRLLMYPTNIIIYLPWYIGVQSVEVGGTKEESTDLAFDLPAVLPPSWGALVLHSSCTQSL